MKFPGLFRITFWKALAVIFMTAGLIAAIWRYSQGLGPTTNLSDRFPWGIWIGFDILVGVGLAAGGFIIAATVYIFNIERFRPILRPTILTAFLGYLLVIAGLLVDLGRPWAIWHAIIYWNPHSVMFEVAWCVMLYTTVLALEFSPVVFERFNMQRPLKIIRAITIPLVVAGVILSTLHQSSLGSLFLIIPSRMHPLWYSNIIPFLFIISCVAAGLAMTIFESFLSARAFGRDIEMPLLSDLARVIAVVLALYFTVRVQDLMTRDALQYAFEFSYQSILFAGEIVLGVVVPFFLLLSRRIRESRTGLFYSSVLVILGFIAHRINTAITSMEQWPTKTYIPSWQEITITAGLVAFGFTAFGFVARYFNVFGHEVEKKGSLAEAGAREEIVEGAVVPSK
ncbi:MAG TPA: Ni/Fe-hydrogenase cytochrome b subunit [Bacteroidota bacterium]|nr:Ni/Fe-hydrogenase cytochrome b subunit [Bacteroidota bacterium]